MEGASGWCHPQEHSWPVSIDMPRTIRYVLQCLGLGVAGREVGLVPARSTNVVRGFSLVQGQNGTTLEGCTTIGFETRGVGLVPAR